MAEDASNMQGRRERARERLRQLILMRETAPKRPAWHAARMRLIWRLHDELAEPISGDSTADPGAIAANSDVNRR
jgi:hypothetical protein